MCDQVKEDSEVLSEGCLDNLRERSERLAIANEIAIEQRFQHPKITVTTVTAVTRRAEPPALHGFKRQ